MTVSNPNRLSSAGPIDPANGFPIWFQDASGLRLELVTLPDPLAPAVGELPKPLQVSALGRKDWSLGSDWYRWTFAAGRDAR